jgi:hypothetical protein
MISKLRLLLLLASVSITFSSFGQNRPVDVNRRQEIEGLVNFYKYILNTLGDPQTTQRNKDVIITQSYRKVFKDDQVQIEDDLVDDRKVVTNKNVRAYLQDVDFFFEQVKFEFEDLQIDSLQKEDGKPYFMASFNSIIKGKSIDGNLVNKSQKRFIEINIDEDANDLKIVSVYTTKVDRSKELIIWWENLSLGWKELFLRKYPGNGQVDAQYLNQIVGIDSLSIKSDAIFMDLEPISELRNLKFLKIANTSIYSLEPVRALNQLEFLDASNTIVVDLSFLKYANKLRTLNLSNTRIVSIEAISNITSLESLDISGTYIGDFGSLRNLTNLKQLNLAKSNFENNEFLSDLKKLKKLDLSNSQLNEWQQIDLPVLSWLDLSNTKIFNLKYLSSLSALQEIRINSTEIIDLTSLLAIPTLRKIYCDDTKVSENHVANLMKKRNDLVVITNSKELRKWWDGLSVSWKSVFIPYLNGSDSPTQEDLVKLVLIDSLNLSNRNLLDGSPISRLKRLRYLDISNNSFVDIDFVKTLEDLDVLICNGMPIADLMPITKATRLRSLSLQVAAPQPLDITMLKQLRNLSVLNINGALVSDDQVTELLQFNDNLLIIYQSKELDIWWSDLDETWQNVFKSTLGIKSAPNNEELHRLTQLRSISIINAGVADLIPLNKFIMLDNLKVQNCPVTSMVSIQGMIQIEKLQISGCPLLSIEPLRTWFQLKELNISNTPIASLKNLVSLTNLQKLDCSGTNIKNLKGIGGLSQLDALNLANTQVWKLDDIVGNEAIKTLICFNTRLKAHKIDAYRALHPECDITFY